MNKFIEDYPVPAETEELIWEFAAAEDCRDQCIKSVFKAKRAIYYAKKARRARHRFWSQVYDLYPELKGVDLEYSYTDSELRIKKKANIVPIKKGLEQNEQTP